MATNPVAIENLRTTAVRIADKMNAPAGRVIANIVNFSILTAPVIFP